MGSVRGQAVFRYKTPPGWVEVRGDDLELPGWQNPLHDGYRGLGVTCIVGSTPPHDSVDGVSDLLMDRRTRG